MAQFVHPYSLYTLSCCCRLFTDDRGVARRVAKSRGLLLVTWHSWHGLLTSAASAAAAVGLLPWLQATHHSWLYHAI